MAQVCEMVEVRQLVSGGSDSIARVPVVSA